MDKNVLFARVSDIITQVYLLNSPLNVFSTYTGQKNQATGFQGFFVTPPALIIKCFCSSLYLCHSNCNGAEEMGYGETEESMSS